MQIIDELEPVKRGPYGGAVGYLSYTGDLDTCINIRSTFVRDGTAYLQAGCGIVADSDAGLRDARVRGQGGGGDGGDRAGVRPGGLGMNADPQPTGQAPRGSGGVSPRVLVIDNYDSFTYNLVQYLGELGAEVEVMRNDVDALLEREPDRLIVSPGPLHARTRPGLSMRAVRRFGERGTPVLGVCLGHQSLAQEFGGRVVRGEPVHGKTAEVEHDGRTIYAGLESPLVVGRYHSLDRGPGAGCRTRSRSRRAPAT